VAPDLGAAAAYPHIRVGYRFAGVEEQPSAAAGAGALVDAGKVATREQVGGVKSDGQ
jgi:hypothetical protein